MKTKLEIDLADILERKCPHGFHAPADIDISTFLEFADDDWSHELDLDIREVLAESKAIALIWDAEMLMSTYTHLTEDQAWDVLQQCERAYTTEHGLTWDDVGEVVNELHPEPHEQRWYGKIQVTINDTDGHSKAEVMTRLRDMAALLSGGMPDVAAEVDAESIYGTDGGLA